MFLNLFKTSKSNDIPQQLYGLVVAQSREPQLYSGFGVPDTVMGRFDMLAMHVFLFVRRLRAEDDELAQDLGQEIFDLFVEDIDRALRQLGIGDTTVPKRKKRMVRSFYGQIEDFDKLLEDSDVDGLARRAAARFFTEDGQQNARELGSYMLKCVRHLAAQPASDLRAGSLSWPSLLSEIA